VPISVGVLSKAVAGELTYPILPCSDIDEAIEFYEALGFRRIYRQVRPNPYAVVAFEDLNIHMSGMDGFDPETSYGSAIVVVPDADALYERFAAGLRTRYGRLPSAGIPRILRPRKRHGTVRGFSVVDPGGNWLRVSTIGDTETDDASSGLERVIDNAARLADARGDDEAGRRLLTRSLGKHPDAPPDERIRALAYLSELNLRLGDGAEAERLLAQADAIALTERHGGDDTALLEHVRQMLAEHQLD
jgi:catechol 2,3-dioxygenase-like lactoylglutathione lyase family enzyme